MTSILIADLVDESAFFLKALLRHRGNVSLASSVGFARELLDTGAHDLLVVDTGYEAGADAQALLDHAASCASPVPVLVLCHPCVCHQLAQDSRVAQVLAKPVHPRQFLDACEQVTSGKVVRYSSRLQSYVA